MFFEEPILSVSEDVGDIKDWSQRRPTDILHIPPSPDEFCKNGEIMVRVPRSGRSTYHKNEYVAGASDGEKVEACSLYVGDASLAISDQNIVISGDGWSMSASSLPGLGLALSKNYGACVAVDILSSWRNVIGLLYEAIGPRRSVALIWKLYGTDRMQETQVYEKHTYCVLAGWFPGLCRLVIDDQNDRYILETPRSSELHTLLTEIAVDKGLLPDLPIHEIPLHSGPLSIERGVGAFGELIRRRSIEITGHHRWLCIDSSNLEKDMSYADFVPYVDMLAKLRGVRAGICTARTILINASNITSIDQLPVSSVLLTPEPLAVGLCDQNGNLTDQLLEGLRKYIFPYASVILCIGNGLQSRIDPRVPDRVRLCTTPISSHPPYMVQYLYRKIDPNLFSANYNIAIVRSDLLWEARQDTSTFEPSGGAGAGAYKTLIVTEATTLSEFTDDAINFVAETQSVIVMQPLDWRPIFCKLLNLLRKPFILKFNG